MTVSLENWLLSDVFLTLSCGPEHFNMIWACHNTPLFDWSKLIAWTFKEHPWFHVIVVLWWLIRLKTDYYLMSFKLWAVVLSPSIWYELVTIHHYSTEVDYLLGLLRSISDFMSLLCCDDCFAWKLIIIWWVLNFELWSWALQFDMSLSQYTIIPLE